MRASVEAILLRHTKTADATGVSPLNHITRVLTLKQKQTTDTVNCRFKKNTENHE